jgi:hypothetical protein
VGRGVGVGGGEVCVGVGEALAVGDGEVCAGSVACVSWSAWFSASAYTVMGFPENSLKFMVDIKINDIEINPRQPMMTSIALDEIVLFFQLKIFLNRPLLDDSASDIDPPDLGHSSKECYENHR